MAELSLDDYLARMRSAVESIQRDAAGAGSLRLSKNDYEAVIRLTNRVLHVIASAEVLGSSDRDRLPETARTRARPDLSLITTQPTDVD